MRHLTGAGWFVDFNSGETQLVSFDWSNNSGAIDMKMDGFVLEGKTVLRLRLSHCLLLKLALRKL